MILDCPEPNVRGIRDFGLDFGKADFGKARDDEKATVISDSWPGPS
jgi:hypothetical protein